MIPLVSIIVPIYNSEKTIQKCIENIKSQSYSNLEVILLDDGSTDNSIKICREFQKQDSRFNVIQKKNEGVSATRNTGIKLANGEFLTFVDSDDFIEPNMIELLMSSIFDRKADIAICGYKEIKEAGIIEKAIAQSMYCSKEDFSSVFIEICKIGLINSPWNKLYRTEMIKKKEIYFDEQLNLGEDLLFNLAYFSNSNNFCILKETLYNYRSESINSLSKRISYDYVNIQKKLLSNVRKYFYSLSPEYNNQIEFENFYLNVINNHILNISKNNNIKYKEKLTMIKFFLNDHNLDRALKISIPLDWKSKMKKVLLKISSPTLFIALNNIRKSTF